MSTLVSVRASFLAAVALVAAAIADPCVETIANTGVFGRRYVDHDQAGVVPALIAALTFVVGLLVLRAIDTWRLHRCSQAVRGDRNTWFATIEAPFSDLLLIAPLQLAAVYGMEFLEAAMVHRAAPAGLSWLGAPPLFSLTVHVLAGAACLWAMRRVIRWLAAGVVAVLRVAAVRLMPVTSAELAAAFRRAVPSFFRAQAPHARQIGGRAPPSFLPQPAS